MNSFEVITAYIPQAVDKYFAQDSKTAILEKGDKFIDVNFKEKGYVKIASMLMDGLSDYYLTQQESLGYLSPSSANPRPANPADYAAYAGNLTSGARDGFRIGNMDVSWELLRLQWVRGKEFRIDYIANEETAGVIIGNAIEEFHRLKVIPEVDVCRFSYIADQASATLGNLVSETISANQIIANFNNAFEWMTEMAVPVDKQILFVNPTIMTLIRNTTELTKFLTQENYRAESGIDFTVEKYAGRPIVEVTSDRFFTNVLLTDNGYRAQSSSKLINYMLVSTKAVVPVRKIEYEKIFGPEMSGLAGFHGYLIQYLLYHGIFVPRNKVPGVYVSVSSSVAATAKTSLLRVDARIVTGYNWKLNNFFTNPSGLRGTIVYSASSLGNLGDTITIDGTTVVAVGIGEIVTEAAAAQAYYFGLVDANGKLIAATASTVTVN